MFVEMLMVPLHNALFSFGGSALNALRIMDLSKQSRLVNSLTIIKHNHGLGVVL